MLGAVNIAARVSVPRLTPPSPARELVVHVVSARFPGGAQALRVASGMAQGLGARVVMHLPREIPYPLPLTAPPVPVAFSEEQMLCMAGSQPLDARIQIYQCRDFTETIRRVLGPESVVVMETPKRWWRTREDKLAALLRRDGHHVILTHAD